ncbi:hypothetical protein BDN67DRAFT_875694, partial [Paxillus ammoniavirescens]
CSTRVQVESAYVKRLKEGEGTHDGQNATSTLPHGVQTSTNVEARNLAAELGMVGEYSKVNKDNEEVFAMLAGTTEIEGTDPTTVREAEARVDWPKWEEAMNKELNTL